jgi:hypothetical protein
LLILSTTIYAGPFVSYKLKGKSIIVTKGNQTSVCKLDTIPTYAVDSYDGDALIVSYHGYIPKKDLDNCQQDKPTHVLTIPDKVGTISDINLKHGIYVSLDFVSANPLSYLATVAHIGTSRNLVSIPGTYIAGKKLSDLRRDAFSISGNDVIGTAIISPSGNFVSPDGTINCSEDAYPGVWDIAHNKRVITDRTSCEHLFDKVEN